MSDGEECGRQPRSRSVHGVVVQALSGRACLRPRVSTRSLSPEASRSKAYLIWPQRASRLHQGESRFAQDPIQLYYTSCSSPEPISVFVIKADAEEPRSRIRENICNLGSVGKPGVIFTGLDPTACAGGGVCCPSTDAMACEAPVCSPRSSRSEPAVIMCFRNPVLILIYPGTPDEPVLLPHF